MILLSSGLSQQAVAIDVIDDLGRTVTVAEPVRRIISLAPHNTENLYLIGAGQLIVGTVSHSDYPAQANNIPQIGSYKHINYELLLALKPDLIVAWYSGNPEPLRKKIEGLGIPIFYSNPRYFEDIIDDLRKLSILTTTQAQADAQIKSLLIRYRELKTFYSKQKTVKIFYQVWNQPLITISGKHLINQAIEICSGRNIFSQSPMIAPIVNIEAVLKSNPEVIIIAAHAKQQKQLKKWWQNWTSIRAVRNKNIYFIDSDIINRQSTRLLQGMAKLCNILQQVRTHTK